MGNEQHQNPQLEKFLSNYVDPQVEYSEAVGREVKIMRPLNPRLEGETALILELPLDDPKTTKLVGKSVVDPIFHFKRQVDQRKKLQNNFLTNLIMQTYDSKNSKCAEFTVCHLAFEYSETNLTRFLTQQKVSRGINKITDQPIKSEKILDFLLQTGNCLEILSRNGILHGFVNPNSIQVFDQSKPNQIFKLLDVALIGFYPKFSHKLL